MEYLFIYLLQLFDSLDVIKITCYLVSICGFLIYLMPKFYYESDKNYYKEYENPLKISKKILCILFSIAIITTFIPTKNTLLVMGGLYLGKKAVNQVVTDEKIKKIDTIINLELDKRIKELKGE